MSKLIPHHPQHLQSVIKKIPPFRSIHQRYSLKEGVLKIFVRFTGQHLCQSLFIKRETLDTSEPTGE